jgi:hypothetical protein
MKITITINTDYNTEKYLHNVSDRLENELLNIIDQFVGTDVDVDYEQKFAEVDAATGEVVNYNPYSFERQFNSKYDKEHMSLDEYYRGLVSHWTFKEVILWLI